MAHENPIINRLNPGYTHEYICEEDRNQDLAVVFYVKNLTVWEYKYIEECFSRYGFGSYDYNTLRIGLTGWRNFFYENNSPVIFSTSNISSIPPQFQLEIAMYIRSLAELDEELESELIMVARWQDYISNLDDVKAKQWSCDYCIENNLANVRNCDGDEQNVCMDSRCGYKGDEDKCPKCKDKMRAPFRFLLNKNLGISVNRCPISLLTEKAIKLCNLVSFTESSHSLPFDAGAFEQTHFFYIVRSVFLSEQNALMKAEYKNVKTPTKGMGKGSKPTPKFFPKQD